MIDHREGCRSRARWQSRNQVRQDRRIVHPHAHAHAVSVERQSVRPTQAVDFGHSSGWSAIAWNHYSWYQKPDRQGGVSCRIKPYLTSGFWQVLKIVDRHRLDWFGQIKFENS